ncbi:MAG TPA: XRE family transcriptional regulator [Acidimicrobiales bacterium]
MSVPPEVASAVAVNTRRLRTARGWSLDALASRSGVSKGMLVQLEQARTNPSLSTLCRVAEALSVSLAALIETAGTPVVKVVAGGTTLWRGAAGGTGDLLVGCDDREHVELWRWELAAGETHESADGHADGTVELVHVLDGELTLVVDGTEHAVAAGGAASFLGDRPHAYRNDGPEPCRLVMVVLQSDADLQAWATSRGAPPPTAQPEAAP